MCIHTEMYDFFLLCSFVFLIPLLSLSLPSFGLIYYFSLCFPATILKVLYF